MSPPPPALILVCCHAIPLPTLPTLPGQNPTNHHDESNWLLEPFQVGETATYLRHIETGVKLLRETNAKNQQRQRGVLVFSGGATKPARLGELGFRGREWTEGRGYHEVARCMLNNVDGGGGGGDGGDSKEASDEVLDLEQYMFHEDYATDSYQNVLLSLIQYSIWLDRVQGRRRHSPILPLEQHQRPLGSEQDITLSLPKKLTIISHNFKRARFMELHLPAIRSLLTRELQSRFDEMKVEFIGIDPPFTPGKMAEVQEGDRKRGYGVWKEDLFGVGEVLSQKRRERGWDEDEFLEAMREGGMGGEAVDEVKRLVRGEMVE